MTEPDALSLPIQLSPTPPTRSVKIAVEYLVDAVDRDLGTKNGRTALYWHLIHVVQQHAGPKDGSATEATHS